MLLQSIHELEKITFLDFYLKKLLVRNTPRNQSSELIKNHLFGFVKNLESREGFGLRKHELMEMLIKFD